MYCPRCGAKNEESNRFCVSCGAELPGVDAAPADDAGGSTGDSPSPPDDKPGLWSRAIGTSRKERLISLGTAAAILVAIGAFILLDPSDSDEPDPFILASDELCAQAKRDIARATQKEVEPGELEGSLLELVVTWRRGQQELAPPPDLQDEAEAYVAAQLDVAAGLGELVTAIDTGASRQELAAVAGAAEETTGALEAEIDALGLPKCGAQSFETGSP